LKIKSYFADTIEEAMDKARIELGPDAMLMNSHRSAPEAKHLGAYEVVFALDHEVPAHRMRVAFEKHASEAKTASPANPDTLATELAELRRQIEGVKHSVTRQTVHLRWTHGASAEAAELYSRLIQAGFSDEMAQDLARAIQTRQESASSSAEWSETPLALSGAMNGALETMACSLEEELRRRVRLSGGLRSEGDRRVVMIVGPSGAGKTATVAKLAVRQGIQLSRQVHLICVDSWRVGANEVLRSYAAILGVGFEVVDTTAALAQAIQLHRHKTILIDTPGFGVDELEAAAELARFCERQRDIEVQLVVPAHARGAVLARALERFSMFRPSGLIATFLDETDLLGGLLEQGIASGLPFSFLCGGQQVPEDLHVAEHAPLLAPVLDLFPRARAVSSVA
jgi:flagellar biosynthesis protein FlhF